MPTAEVLLVVATAVHAGFQLVVTLLVYPALATVPDSSWADAHTAHSRRITPVVAVVYAGLVGASASAILGDPSPARTWSVALSGVAVLVTAAVAAPAHRRLGLSRDPEVWRRLMAGDRLRCAAALASAAVAVAGALS